MGAKTVFLNNNDEVIIHEGQGHSDNYDLYMNKYFKFFNISDYVPIMLLNFNHAIIDLSDDYKIGVVYLPEKMSEFQKSYFKNNEQSLKRYNLYLYGYSLESAILYDELLSIIENKPVINLTGAKKRN